MLGSLIQGAAEYGAVSGQGGYSSSPGMYERWLDRGVEMIADNPVGLLGLLVCLLIVVGLIRTRGYRS
jgi:hypothetical protein